jgi:peptidoglycan/LPS O-acetylase OafA/YrhL
MTEATCPSVQQASSQAKSDTDLASFHVEGSNGFTMLRYLFAATIFIYHFFITSGSQQAMQYNVWPCVNGFFIISGFLVFNSYIRRPDCKSFFRKRLRRIYPAYLTAVCFCFLIGACLTTLSVREFFSSSVTWKYLAANLMFLNFLQPTLPGVFENNAMPFLDGALWTLKVEVLFYATVPVVHWLSERYNRNVVLLTLSLLSMAYYGVTAELFSRTGNTIFYSLNHQIPGMLAYFYVPALVLVNRAWFCRWRKVLLPIAVAVYALGFFCSWLAYLGPFSYTLIILWIAYFVRPTFCSRGWTDISYEIFLLHFPILQTLWALGMGDHMIWAFITAFVAVSLAGFFVHRLCAKF